MHILSNMLWLDRETHGLDEDKLRREFTIYGRPKFVGHELPVCKTYAETPKYFGVPRAASARFKKKGIEWEDRTNYPNIEWPEMEFGIGETWRQGQEDAVFEMKQWFVDKYQGRLEGKCGTGKSMVSLAVAAHLGTPTLVLVHKQDLAQNWHKDARRFFPGLTLGHIQGNKWRYIGAHLTTCMAQTLWSKRGKFTETFLKSFGMIIIDEGHRYSAETFEYAPKLFPARFRLSVSATWRRRDGLEAWKQHIGPIITKIKSDRMTGRYTQVDTGIKIKAWPRMPWAVALNVLAADTRYHTWLSNEIVKAAKKGRTILVVGDRKAQLKEVQALAHAKCINEGINKTSGLFFGGMKPARLRKAKTCDIIYATYQMMAEGNDVPALDTLFFATPRSDIEQVIGRLQRIQPDKKSLLVVDPIVNGYPLFQCTASKRIGYYAKLKFKEAK